ncbi:acetyltransferase, GNAT family [Clostridiales bacterium KLE1615]|nr:acetyltransferase, GNAT family [Clostridiales bacterium KLE1615]
MRLEQGKLCIKNAEQEDCKQLVSWWNDGAVMAHAGFPNGLGTNEKKVQKQIAADSDDTRRHLVIWYDGNRIGEMSYANLGDSLEETGEDTIENRTADIGIKICNSTFKEKGLGKIVLSMLIRELFSRGYTKIVLDTNLKNKRAQHVYERLGFQKVNIRMDAWIDQVGEKQSVVDYELTKEHFVDFALMDEISRIRKAERSFKMLFSQKCAFSEHLEKWQDDDLYDMYDHNQFVPLLDDPTDKELEQAIAYQRQLGRGFLKLDTREKLDEALTERFSLEECCTETMLLRNKQKNIEAWKCNPDVIIHDSASSDVLADLLQIDIETFASDYGEDFIRRRDVRYVKKAMETPGFHYYVAYLDGKVAGSCYACAIDGYVVMDALVVREAFRKRYVATTLMKHIASQFKEEMFLHADADDTPKEMYRKMGFETVDELYEYLKMWEL